MIVPEILMLAAMSLFLYQNVRKSRRAKYIVSLLTLVAALCISYQYIHSDEMNIKRYNNVNIEKRDGLANNEEIEISTVNSKSKNDRLSFIQGTKVERAKIEKPNRITAPATAYRTKKAFLRTDNTVDE